jgi:hypothetical protein
MSIKKEDLIKFLNPVFIETGTYLGQTTRMAKELGFGKVISIEASRSNYELAKENLKDVECELINGDSGSVLIDVIRKLSSPATIWLDGHNLAFGSDYQETRSSGICDWPLLKELEQIIECPDFIDTVLIDDARGFPFGGHNVRGTSVDEVKDMLTRANKNFNIYLIDGVDFQLTPMFLKDIVVATLKSSL